MGLISLVLYALAIIGFALVVGIIIQVQQQKDMNDRDK
jgi:hypothetical protein